MEGVGVELSCCPYACFFLVALYCLNLGFRLSGITFSMPAHMLLKLILKRLNCLFCVRITLSQQMFRSYCKNAILS